MASGTLRFNKLLMIVILSMLTREVVGIRFVIDREECLSHNVEYEGDTVHVSFVVIKAETVWHFTEDGVDLVSHLKRLWVLSDMCDRFLQGRLVVFSGLRNNNKEASLDL
ncbi:transmembrane emp24 domain-containing protein p24beta2-like protein [Tanacetum coccineum]